MMSMLPCDWLTFLINTSKSIVRGVVRLRASVPINDDVRKQPLQQEKSGRMTHVTRGKILTNLGQTVTLSGRDNFLITWQSVYAGLRFSLHDGVDGEQPWLSG